VEIVVDNDQYHFRESNIIHVFVLLVMTLCSPWRSYQGLKEQSAPPPSPYAFRQVSWKIEDQIKLLNIKKTSNYNIICSSCQFTFHGDMFRDSHYSIHPAPSYCAALAVFTSSTLLTTAYTVISSESLTIIYGERHSLWSSRQVKSLTYRWLLYFC
jgi:hypothetical protein